MSDEVQPLQKENIWNYYNNTPAPSVRAGYNAYRITPSTAPKALAVSRGVGMAGLGGALSYLATYPLELVYESMAHPNMSRKMDYVDNSALSPDTQTEAYRATTYKPTFWNFY